MLGTLHLLTGAVIGETTSNVLLVFPLALLSHYLLDFVPHIDPGTYRKKGEPYTWKQSLFFILDAVGIITFTFAFYFSPAQRGSILVGSIAAQLPDLLIPFEHHPLLRWAHRLHRFFHWNRKRAQQWRWYMIGLATSTLVGVTTFWILWRTILFSLRSRL